MSEHMVEEYVWKFGEPPERSLKRESKQKKNYQKSLKI